MMQLPVNYNELSWQERRKVREEYIKQQNGKCCFCNRSLDKPPMFVYKITESLFPPNFFNNLVHLHHNHKTGMTIGAIHAYCNAVSWEYEGV